MCAVSLQDYLDRKEKRKFLKAAAKKAPKKPDTDRNGRPGQNSGGSIFGSTQGPNLATCSSPARSVRRSRRPVLVPHVGHPCHASPVQEVMAAGGGLADIGRKIADNWKEQWP